MIKIKEHWINKYWRPHMGYTYIVICLFDFVIAPILNWVYFAKVGGTFTPWKSLTMSEAGLFHLAMGAILGVSAWTRGKEKIKRYESAQSNDRDDIYNEPEPEPYDRAEYRDRIRNASRETR